VACGRGEVSELEMEGKKDDKRGLEHFREKDGDCRERGGREDCRSVSGRGGEGCVGLREREGLHTPH